MTAQQLPDHATRRLARTSWKLKTSWWILPPLLTLGVLSWVGFVWAGYKTGKARYYVSAGAWLLVSLSVTILPAGDYVAAIAVACVTLPTAQAIIMNRGYLVDRAVGDL